ncbi:MAG TPA: glycine cleavage system protein H [Terriglobales bacterium]|jgi:glycine cleavage system H lipoate-binding protein
MTVVLMLLMFSIFLVADYFLRRKPLPAQATVLEHPIPKMIPSVVAGFQMPENLSYHPGHTWALRESPNLVRVGIDDFASRLTGKIDSVMLPQRGQWIRQGQKFLTVFHNGQSAAMVSPIEGTVADVNSAALQNPDAARKDPYGDGWLVKVDSPDAKTNFRNLLNGSLARSWMEDTALHLRIMMSPTAAVLAQDGGVAMDNLTAHLTGEEWSRVAKEFFLA